MPLLAAGATRPLRWTTERKPTSEKFTPSLAPVFPSIISWSRIRLPGLLFCFLSPFRALWASSSSFPPLLFSCPAGSLIVGVLRSGQFNPIDINLHRIIPPLLETFWRPFWENNNLTTTQHSFVRSPNNCSVAQSRSSATAIPSSQSLRSSRPWFCSDRHLSATNDWPSFKTSLCVPRVVVPSGPQKSIAPS